MRTTCLLLPCVVFVALSGCHVLPAFTAAQCRIEAQAMPPGADGLTVSGDCRAAVVRVDSPRGIGTGELRRLSRRWPRQVILQLHLRGLERLTVSAGDWTAEISVLSHGSHRVIYHCREGTGPETTHFAAGAALSHVLVRAVSDEREVPISVPLAADYFEVTLPAVLFEHNPPVITIHWVDFFRG